MSRASIITSTGTTFDFLETTLDMFNIEDIAHSLSQMNRFAGHARYPYPVAQHSRLGSYLFADPAMALRFLLHDGSEAYLIDLPRPLKHYTTLGAEYRKIEADIQGLLYMKYGIFGQDPELIHRVDTQMLYAEKEALLPEGTEWETDWGLKNGHANIKIVETSFRDNKRMFLDRFHELYHGE
jgi:hypothetical protein